MKFSGLQKTSLLDYPDRVASVIFTPGCNLRCPYCHNHKIATNPQPPFLQEGVALAILEDRKRYIDSVVVTGGEPCMHRELPKFLSKLKERGFFVKLDTNGFFPDILQECLSIVDYVAMDVKTTPEKYALLGTSDIAPFKRSIELLKTGNVPYEFRITVVPEFVDEADIPVIGELVKGAKVLVLQQFVPNDTLDRRFTTIKPYTPEVIERFAQVLKSYVDAIVLKL
ncbi:MAG: anaerobic ribonucleoside-triphosphate reductase activating protein [Crenarchaeota archaeon]|jgi:pyruvate formate lyase activating enzyme|nr:anaerobic ribonucleoside-triphosphate reductase activating protein [Thermoproteota archaeon]